MFKGKRIVIDLDTGEGMVSKKVLVKATLLCDIWVINIPRLNETRDTITFVWQGSSMDMLLEIPFSNSSFFDWLRQDSIKSWLNKIIFDTVNLWYTNEMEQTTTGLSFSILVFKGVEDSSFVKIQGVCYVVYY